MIARASSPTAGWSVGSHPISSSINFLFTVGSRDMGRCCRHSDYIFPPQLGLSEYSPVANDRESLSSAPEPISETDGGAAAAAQARSIQGKRGGRSGSDGKRKTLGFRTGKTDPQPGQPH